MSGSRHARCPRLLEKQLGERALPRSVAALAPIHELRRYAWLLRRCKPALSGPVDGGVLDA
jgi:hypothetical protein